MDLLPYVPAAAVVAIEAVVAVLIVIRGLQAHTKRKART